ncbi:shikimate dehydrogenase [Actinotalea sp.]|uniref:shikimate dehydrogenase n=1 Tax=Actinotalea sp. TaxID=1872145 RepID=UPI002D1C92AF|nr:shikimate dehydrogenase [Actinotalea sp.]HQY33859.1 shikimate dehydrogenase [Actinotalea sp.]HRA50026.1 shikimate dehydrogenase [Actinotalea sp.]
MSTPGRRAAVLGHPIAHSLSPVLHRAAYAALGLHGWRYDALDVTADQLSEVVEDLDATWAGLSLTMPLKQTVLPLLDHVEPLAEVLGVVNTVLVQGGRVRTLVGANTDVHGIVAALGAPAVRRGVVLGGGATAASSLAALAELGCTSPTVLVRSLGRAGSLMRAAHRMGVEPRFWAMEPVERLLAELLAADVVISTLPPHGADALAATLAARLAGEPGRGAPLGLLLDCAYDPRPTALGTTWAHGGGTVVGGERMLLHQAAEQVRLMTGRPAPLEAMDVALTAALDRPAGDLP